MRPIGSTCRASVDNTRWHAPCWPCRTGEHPAGGPPQAPFAASRGGGLPRCRPPAAETAASWRPRFAGSHPCSQAPLTSPRERSCLGASGLAACWRPLSRPRRFAPCMFQFTGQANPNRSATATPGRFTTAPAKHIREALVTRSGVAAAAALPGGPACMRTRPHQKKQHGQASSPPASRRGAGQAAKQQQQQQTTPRRHYSNHTTNSQPF